MKRLHRKLRARYPWYDTWHNHPKHELFHWVIFILCAAFAVIAVFLNFKYGFGQNEKAKNLKPELAPASAGAIIGSAEDHILVAFKDNVSENKKTEVRGKYHLKEKSKIKEIGVEILSLPSKDTPEKAAQQLNKENDIDFAEVDAIVTPSFIPNDPNYPDEWHHEKINSPLAWDSANGSGIIVAIIDTGVDPSHPDLISNLVPGWNFYDNNFDTSDVYGHGTEVAGVAAGTGNNGIEIAGEAYNAKIMPLRVSDINGYASYSAIANAIIYGVNHGAKVMNISYQVGGSNAVGRAAKYAKRNNGLTVIAEGNNGSLSSYKNNPDTISVSATDNYDLKTNWSSYGDDVDVSAPGQAILTTIKGGRVGYFSGTSFSAPLTTGVLALIWTINPAFTPDQVQNILFNSALDLGLPGWDQYYGWGRIDAGKAAMLAKINK